MSSLTIANYNLDIFYYQKDQCLKIKGINSCHNCILLIQFRSNNFRKKQEIIFCQIFFTQPACSATKFKLTRSLFRSKNLQLTGTFLAKIQYFFFTFTFDLPFRATRLKVPNSLVILVRPTGFHKNRKSRADRDRKTS